MHDTWLDADQTAQSLHITKATLYKLIRRGRVPATKVHGKWRFTREAIVDLFDSTCAPPVSQTAPEKLLQDIDWASGDEARS